MQEAKKAGKLNESEAGKLYQKAWSLLSKVILPPESNDEGAKSKVVAENSL